MSFFKSIWKSNGRHKKLSEELVKKDLDSEPTEAEAEEEKNGLSFKLKYLGESAVDAGGKKENFAETINAICKNAKTKQKKLQLVVLTLSNKGVEVQDLEDNEILRVSIYSISNCSTNTANRRVFSFIATDQYEIMRCHAFLCPKRKVAQTVTLAMAQVFTAAYEAWRISPGTKEFIEQIENETNKCHEAEQENNLYSPVVEEKLIDFTDDDSDDQDCTNFSSGKYDDLFTEYRNISSPWERFEDNFENFVIDHQSQKTYKIEFSMA